MLKNTCGWIAILNIRTLFDLKSNNAHISKLAMLLRVPGGVEVDFKMWLQNRDLNRGENFYDFKFGSVRDSIEISIDKVRFKFRGIQMFAFREFV